MIYSGLIPALAADEQISSAPLVKLSTTSSPGHQVYMQWHVNLIGLDSVVLKSLGRRNPALTAAKAGMSPQINNGG